MIFNVLENFSLNFILSFKQIHQHQVGFSRSKYPIDRLRVSSDIDELTSSMAKISHSYNDIADLYKTRVSDNNDIRRNEKERFSKGHESIRDFTERIQDYIGMLSCFPVIINLQRVNYRSHVHQSPPAHLF